MNIHLRWVAVVAQFLLPAAPAHAREPAPVELSAATYFASGAEGAGESVRLPHLWRKDTGAPTTASYRLKFDVPADASDFAVRIAGTNLPFEARVNGRHAHENGGPRSQPVPLASWRAAPAFRIPLELLRPGENELELIVFANRRGLFALGTVSVGTGEAIAALDRRGWLLHNMLPLAVASMLGVVGVISLALWRGRGDYALFAWLGAGTLLWAVQNFTVQLPVRLLPQPHFSVLVIALYAWFPLCLAVFFLRFAYQRSVLFERIAIGTMLLAAPVLYAAEALGQWDLASIGLRGIVLLFIGAALLGILRFALRSRDTKGMLLLAAGTLCVGGAVYDYLRSLAGEDLQAVYVTTYAGLVLVLLAAWMLLDRYQQAYRAYRDLNAELEQRVQAANAELQLRLEQTQAAREQAEQASIAKSRFFAAASHDLRQPLHSLGLFTSALDEHLTSPQARATASSIRESITALESLFDALLDLSRLDAGIVTVQPKNVMLQSLFDRLAREFHVEAVARELRLRFVPTRAVVRTDPLLMERILTNLVANALRYTPHGGVVVGVRRLGGRVAIAVCDTGIGIAPEQQALVFEEFFQVDNPGRDRSRGLGLGLAIVRRLTQLLDHPLTLHSRPGRGSCFRLEVPLATGEAEPLAEPMPAIDDGALRDLRVLVVDDDLMVREGTSALLRRWRAEPRLASSSREALHALDQGFAPDLMIVDLRLGETRDGIDVIEALRTRLGRPVPALLVSGDTGAAELLRVRSSGILLLTKPVAPAKLRSAMRTLTAKATASVPGPQGRANGAG
jgi:signal transduction histidine kinase/ActR/RegA family two-component response regulator